MGTYYRYVNYMRKEFVGLSDLRDGGDKEGAVLSCAPAFLWLMLYPLGDGYKGRWRQNTENDYAQLVSDGLADFSDMDDNFLNISPGLLHSMRNLIPDVVRNYKPRVHDVTPVQRVKHIRHGTYELANPVSAECECGWRTGAVYGGDREHVLELAMSAHMNGE